MKNIGDILDIKHKKSLRLVLLLGSTVFILFASALAYTGVIIEKPLEVYNTSGGSAGSGPTGSAGASLSTGILILAVIALIVGFAVFGFLREAYKHISEARGSLPTGPGPIPSGEEGWEESPRKEEGEESATTA